MTEKNQLEVPRTDNEGLSIRPRFVLLSMPRTGSVMITEYMTTHPDIVFFGALFSLKGWNRGDGPLALRLRALQPEYSDFETRVSRCRQFINELFEGSRDKTWVGLKQHLSGPQVVTETLMADRTIAKILLTRNNLLASYSSQKVTEVTMQGRVGANESVKKGKGHFDPAEFEQHIRIRTRIYRRWRERLNIEQAPWMELDYAEARKSEGIGRIMRFIGADGTRLKALNTAKRNPDDLPKRFQNESDVRRYLTDHRLEHWTFEQ